jgi:LytS/YehU family sensor histidine kinase
MLKLYMDLEKIRFREPFQYEIEVEDSLNIEYSSIPNMMIQPYVENAIIHGFKPKKSACRLLLRFSLKGEQMEVVIRDNGVGRAAGAAKKNKGHESKGMALNEQRLTALGIKTDLTNSVMITDLVDDDGTPAGTEVKLILPLIND